jgi:hypothetical protein
MLRRARANSSRQRLIWLILLIWRERAEPIAAAFRIKKGESDWLREEIWQQKAA